MARAFSLPLWGGVGVGVARVGTQNHFQHTIDILHHFVIPEAHYTIAFYFKKLRSLCVNLSSFFRHPTRRRVRSQALGHGWQNRQCNVQAGLGAESANLAMPTDDASSTRSFRSAWVGSIRIERARISFGDLMLRSRRAQSGARLEITSPPNIGYLPTIAASSAPHP